MEFAGPAGLVLGVQVVEGPGVFAGFINNLECCCARKVAARPVKAGGGGRRLMLLELHQHLQVLPGLQDRQHFFGKELQASFRNMDWYASEAE